MKRNPDDPDEPTTPLLPPLRDGARMFSTNSPTRESGDDINSESILLVFVPVMFFVVGFLSLR